MAKSSGSSELGAITSAVTAQMAEGRTRSRPLPAPTALMNTSTDVAEMRDVVRELKASAGKPLRVRLDLCDDGDSHAAPLNPDRVEKARANLEHNDQATPARVRPKPDGRFEILSGRHRKAALLQLGRTEWDVVIQDVDDATAVRSSFYDNLVGPDLTDYEKYRGFARLKSEFDLTLEQLARESGENQKTVAHYFVFDKLLAEHLDIVAANQARMTYTLVEALVPFLESSPAKVTTALQFAVSNPKASIPAVVAAAKPAATAPAKQRPVLFKSGKKPYAELDSRGGRFVISLKNDTPEETKEVLRLLTELLKERAESAKASLSEK